jgi:glycosyltransferase involved in cell wall biosynthesis
VTGSPRTLLIVPAFNEEEALPTTLAELREVVPTIEVVVIDDGSSDRTAEVARANGAVCLTLPFNLGVGGALRLGFRYAVRHGFERAIQFDADGQHVAAEIQRLTDALDAGANMAIGSRFAEESGYVVGRTRRQAMSTLRLGIRVLSGRRFTDTSSGFRAFDRNVLELFATTYPEEYLGDTVEALLLALRSGYEVVEVPVVMRERAGGTPSARSVRLAYHYLRVAIVLLSTASRRPVVRPPGDDDAILREPARS